jgi:hypothetical protein
LGRGDATRVSWVGGIDRNFRSRESRYASI